MRLGELDFNCCNLLVVGWGIGDSSSEEEELSLLNCSFAVGSLLVDNGEVNSSMCIVLTPPDTSVVVVVTTC